MREGSVSSLESVRVTDEFNLPRRRGDTFCPQEKTQVVCFLLAFLLPRPLGKNYLHDCGYSICRRQSLRDRGSQRRPEAERDGGNEKWESDDTRFPRREESDGTGKTRLVRYYKRRVGSSTCCPGELRWPAIPECESSPQES